MVAPKRASRAVRALEAGGEPDDQQSRRLRAKRGHRAIEPIRMRSLVIVPERHEPRAEGTVRRGLGWRHVMSGRVMSSRVMGGGERHDVSPGLLYTSDAADDLLCVDL